MRTRFTLDIFDNNNYVKYKIKKNNWSWSPLCTRNTFKLLHCSFYRCLSACYNPLGILPAEIGKLKSLTELWLANCQLASIPEELGSLVNLMKLSLRGNSLTVVVADIRKLVNLQWLSLAENHIQELPEEFKHLHCLSYLSLNSNRFESVPEVLLHLPALASLHMKRNYVKSVSDTTILGLSQLTRLDLRENVINVRPVHWKVRSIWLSPIKIVIEESQSLVLVLLNFQTT